MNDADIISILKEVQAIKNGHFVLTSGRHSDTYIQCARVLESPALTMELADEAISRLPEDLEVDIVASPAVGGILFGFAVGLSLGVNMIFSERKDGQMMFRRSFEVPKGAKVLVAEDVVTTGSSVKEVCDLIEEQGGEVVGVVSLIDRCSGRVFNQPFYPLLTLPTPSWQPEECQLCAAGEEVHSLGSRKL